MNRRERIGGIAFLLIAVFVFAASLRLGVGALGNPGPGFVLFWASISLAVCACILSVRVLPGKAASEAAPGPGERAESRNPAIVLAALIAYCAALPKLGYRVSTFLLMAVLFGLGGMKPWRAALCSLMTVLLSHGLFVHLLRTPLPGGVLGF